MDQPSTSKGINTPSRSKGINTPSASKVFNTPSTSKNITTASTSRDINTPSTCRAGESIITGAKTRFFGDADEIDCREIIKRIKYNPHNGCTQKCAKILPVIEGYPTHNPYLKPYFYNFARIAVKQPHNEMIGIVYLAPCGVLLLSYKDIACYLKSTKLISQLKLENFTLSKSFHISNMEEKVAQFKSDVSGKKEKVPISLCKDGTDPNQLALPIKEYINEPEYEPRTYELIKDLARTINRCEKCDLNGCETCTCANSTLFYKYDRLYHYSEHAILECTSECSCDPDHCRFNLTKRGLRMEFQIYSIKGKGLAVRSTHFISRGSFVFSYAGILTKVKDSESDNDEYVANFVRLYKDSDGKLKIKNAELFDDDENCINIDGLNKSNVARFSNHSCMPNLFVQSVLVEAKKEKVMVPILSLFAIRDIYPFEELCWDYKYPKTDNITLKCLCECPTCLILLR